MSSRLSHAVAAILARSVSQNSPHVVEVQGLMVSCESKEEREYVVRNGHSPETQYKGRSTSHKLCWPSVLSSNGNGSVENSKLLSKSSVRGCGPVSTTL